LWHANFQQVLLLLLLLLLLSLNRNLHLCGGLPATIFLRNCLAYSLKLSRDLCGSLYLCRWLMTESLERLPPTLNTFICYLEPILTLCVVIPLKGLNVQVVRKPITGEQFPPAFRAGLRECEPLLK
jgi:hypothetical protein